MLTQAVPVGSADSDTSFLFSRVRFAEILGLPEPGLPTKRQEVPVGPAGARGESSPAGKRSRATAQPTDERQLRFRFDCENPWSWIRSRWVKP